jgi:hypothetical protein
LTAIGITAAIGVGLFFVLPLLGISLPVIAPAVVPILTLFAVGVGLALVAALVGAGLTALGHRLFASSGASLIMNPEKKFLDDCFKTEEFSKQNQQTIIDLPNNSPSNSRLAAQGEPLGQEQFNNPLNIPQSIFQPISAQFAPSVSLPPHLDAVAAAKQPPSSDDVDGDGAVVNPPLAGATSAEAQAASPPSP